MKNPVNWALAVLVAVFVAMLVAYISGVRVPGAVTALLLVGALLLGAWISRYSRSI